MLAMATSFQTFIFLLITCSCVPAKIYTDVEKYRALSVLLPGNNDAPSSVKGVVEVLQAISPERRLPTYMRIKVTGLTPNSVHGFHIHEFGDTYTSGCSSTGGHYNPFKKTHGGPNDKVRHVGDLGNVYSDRHGVVEVVKRDFFVSLIGEHNVLGRAFVLHELRDDLGRGGNEGSKTTGNAGPRIACGVIALAPVAKKS